MNSALSVTIGVGVSLMVIGIYTARPPLLKRLSNDASASSARQSIVVNTKGYMLSATTNDDLGLFKWDKFENLVRQICNQRRTVFNGNLKIGNGTLNGESHTNGIATDKLSASKIIFGDYAVSKHKLTVWRQYQDKINRMNAKLNDLNKNKLSYGQTIYLRSDNIKDGPACLSTKGNNLHLGNILDRGTWVKAKTAQQASRCVDVKVEKM